MAEPPYVAIWEHLLRGEIVPFLGAGASFTGRPADAAWDGRPAGFLPLGGELAHWLARASQFPESELGSRPDLAKIASYYEEAVDRASLLDRLRQVFCREYQPGPIHELLAEIDVPLLIVTTNYDDLIESAFKRKGRPYHLVVHPTDRPDLAASVLWWKPGEAEPVARTPKELPLSLNGTSIIYKMHGSALRAQPEWSSFVISEEDYIDFLARMTGQSAIPARFMLHFRRCRFLFLGYGLGDWNLRVMLRSLRSTIASRPAPAPDDEVPDPVPSTDLRSWAIQYRPSELEEILWESRKVRIFDLELDEFVRKMRDHRNEIPEGGALPTRGH